jgi:hypothetical protein
MNDKEEVPMKKFIVWLTMIIMLLGSTTGCLGWWHKGGHHDNGRHHDKK